MAALFDETPKKLKNTSADGFIKTKGAGIAAVAGKKTDEATKELLSLLNGDYSPAPVAKKRCEKNGSITDAAGKELLYGLFTAAASESIAGAKVAYNLLFA